MYTQFNRFGRLCEFSALKINDDLQVMWWEFSPPTNLNEFQIETTK